MQQAPHALYLRLLAVVAAALVCVALAGRIRDTALVDVQTIATTPSTIVKSTTPSTTTTTATIPQSGATAALLFDATAQTVLAAQNADRAGAPASLTKLVTAAVALQHLKPDAKLTVGAGNRDGPRQFQLMLYPAGTAADAGKSAVRHAAGIRQRCGVYRGRCTPRGRRSPPKS